MPEPLITIPIKAPVKREPFDLMQTLLDCLDHSDETLRDGDVLAVSSKYVAISEGRVVKLDDIVISAEAHALAERYQMKPTIAQIVLQEADRVFGGIPGFLLTRKDGILSANAGIDRSNIPSGYAVLFPEDVYASAEKLRRAITDALNVEIGVVLTDSWLMPVRLGTTGVALATAGFKPTVDERGKADLFGNPMQVTVRGIADSIAACAQLVMGERDEATPFAIVRNSGVQLADVTVTEADITVDTDIDIYMQSLTVGLLEEIPAPANGNAPVPSAGD